MSNEYTYKFDIQCESNIELNAAAIEHIRHEIEDFIYHTVSDMPGIHFVQVNETPIKPHVESFLTELSDRFHELAREFASKEYQYSSRRVWANELRAQNRITPDEIKLLEVYYGNLWTYVGD